MNEFRSRLLAGQSGPGLLRAKSPRNKAGTSDTLERVPVPRSEVRTTDHRDDHRHRLADDRGALASHNGQRHEVRLVNLSGGGAMIEAPFRPQLWDRVELDLGSGGSSGRLECAVRWIRGDRLGLEFAHETWIETDPDTRSALLRAVLTTSFPDVALELSVAEPEFAEARPVELADTRRGDPRHPLIWSGLVHYNHASTPVRLRNISAAGALIEGNPALALGAELLLELGKAGSHFALVSWTGGDQAGLAFRSPFDLALLAKARPQLAPVRWAKPAYLGDESADSSPWASEWGRLSLAELHKTLGR